MKIKVIVAVMLVLSASLVFTTVASAKISKTKITTIINDGQDGTIDGHYTAAEIQAAINYVANDPLQQQYSDLQGILEAYLASLKAPGVKSGTGSVNGSASWELAFTGSRILFVFGTGLALIGSGFMLRRRHA